MITEHMTTGQRALTCWAHLAASAAAAATMSGSDTDRRPELSLRTPESKLPRSWLTAVGSPSERTRKAKSLNSAADALIVSSLGLGAALLEAEMMLAISGTRFCTTEAPFGERHPLHVHLLGLTTEAGQP